MPKPAVPRAGASARPDFNARTPVAPPRWMAIARSYIGVHEGSGLHSNPAVMRFFVEAGHAEIRDDHTTPWCAAFVGAVLHEAHLPTTGTLWALDYEYYGHKLDAPVIGAIGTKTRRGGGHVFFVAGFDSSHVFALGGNQNDRVCIEAMARTQIHSYSWPPGVPVTASTPLADRGVAGAREA